VKKLIEAGKAVKGSTVLIAGITFKENVRDIRNSRVIDIINELKEYGVETIVCDPIADKVEVKHEYSIELTDYDPDIKVDGVVLAVAHHIFLKKLTVRALTRLLTMDHGPSTIKNKGVVVDVKGMFEIGEFDAKRVLYWRL
jgi:UDP-N-acetyl-D-galactosamine dehydrogenase